MKKHVYVKAASSDDKFSEYMRDVAEVCIRSAIHRKLSPESMSEDGYDEFENIAAKVFSNKPEFLEWVRSNDLTVQNIFDDVSDSIYDEGIVDYAALES